MTSIFVPLNQIFVNPVETPGLMDLYPVSGSPLIGAGTRNVGAALLPAYDFNGVPRPSVGPVDIGAYRLYTPNNPGWQIDNELDMGYLKQFWLPGDINGDRSVNVGDLQLLAGSWAKSYGIVGYNACADVNDDNRVNVGDLQTLVTHWGDAQ